MKGERRWLSYLLVAIQFACLIFLALTGPWLARGWRLALEIAGGLLGLWAVLTMKPGRFNITPDVRADARLVQEGPYRWIRHPMYSSLILVGLALVLEYPTGPRWGALLALAANFIAKLHVEEQLLSQAFPSYASYQARTKRLVPYIY